MVGNSLAAEVRRLRAEHGINQRTLAEELGVSQGTVAHVETGRNKSPDVKIIAGLSRVFGVPIDHLVMLVAPDGPAPPPVPRRDYYPGVLKVGRVNAGEFEKENVYADPKPLAPRRYPRTAEAVAVDVAGMSCSRFGIHEGDEVIVEPGREPVDGQFVVCQNADGFTLKGVLNGKLVRFGPDDGEPVEVECYLPTKIYGTVIDVIVGVRTCLPPQPRARRRRPK